MFWDKPDNKKQKTGDQAPVRNPGTGFFFWKASKPVNEPDSAKEDQHQRAGDDEPSPGSDAGKNDD